MAEFANGTSALRQNIDTAVSETNFTNNSSLLLEGIFSSADILPKILKFLISPKEKVRVERVCQSFRKYSQTLEAWSSINTIIICKYHIGYCWINGCRIDEIYTSEAIESIFFRNRNVKELDLRQCGSPDAYRSILETIMQIGKDKYKNLTTMLVIGQESYESDITRYIELLVSTFRHQLTSLDAQSVKFIEASDVTHWWKRIGECVNLKGVVLDVMKNQPQSVAFMDMIKSAMRGKSIQRLYLYYQYITENELIDIIESFANQSSIQELACCNWGYFSLFNFTKKIPAVQLANLQSFQYFDTAFILKTDPAWSTLLRLPKLCPQLQSLTLTKSERNISASQMVELVVEYLTLQMECISLQSPKAITVIFQFKNDPFKVEDTRPLVDDNECDVTHFKDRFDNDFYHVQLGTLGNVYLYLCDFKFRP